MLDLEVADAAVRPRPRPSNPEKLLTATVRIERASPRQPTTKIRSRKSCE
jgi:hypothetical protein